MNHHEYASLFPMLPDAELRTLADDIKSHGQMEPIITLNGEILDGRNRYRACEMVKVSPWLQAYRGDDPLGYVISHNLHRRHLTESQRGLIASNLATMKAGGDRKSDKINSPIGGLIPISTQTRQEAADALKVGTSTVDRARRIQKHGAPELVRAVESGEVKLGTAEAIITLNIEDQQKVVAKGPEAVRAKAKQIRDGTTEPVPVKQTGRLPNYKPDHARECWMLAKGQMDRILPQDVSRVAVLKEAKAYIDARLAKNL